MLELTRGLEMSARVDNYEIKKQRNKHFLSSMKTQKKKFITLIDAKKQEESSTALVVLDKTIQKLKSKGIIHKNKASRLVSRLAKSLSGLKK
jgi:small subunit ribosomal protein S20